MNRWILGHAFAALSLLALGSAASAATSHTQFKVKGDTALAIFRATDPNNPCLENFVMLVGSDLVEKQSPGDPTPFVRASLIATQKNTCHDVTTFSGEGGTPVRSFQVARDLSSAPLATTVPVFDT